MGEGAERERTTVTIIVEISRTDDLPSTEEIEEAVAMALGPVPTWAGSYISIRASRERG